MTLKQAQTLTGILRLLLGAALNVVCAVKPRAETEACT